MPEIKRYPSTDLQCLYSRYPFEVIESISSFTRSNQHPRNAVLNWADVRLMGNSSSLRVVDETKSPPCCLDIGNNIDRTFCLHGKLAHL
uniref:Uncharacterized protein n=1 Tax=Salix viminalis TaxID=40686 RepID=A0A6N2KGT7_SALVM